MYGDGHAECSICQEVLDSKETMEAKKNIDTGAKSNGMVNPPCRVDEYVSLDYCAKCWIMKLGNNRSAHGVHI